MVKIHSVDNLISIVSMEALMFRKRIKQQNKGRLAMIRIMVIWRDDKIIFWWDGYRIQVNHRVDTTPLKEPRRPITSLTQLLILSRDRIIILQWGQWKLVESIKIIHMSAIWWMRVQSQAQSYWCYGKSLWHNLKNLSTTLMSLLLILCDNTHEMLVTHRTVVPHEWEAEGC